MMSVLTFLLSLYFAHQDGHLEVSSTGNIAVFNVIYQADMAWNVEVKLLNTKGKKKFSKTLKNSDGFVLPLNLEGEDSGEYQVVISTPAYDLVKSFSYVNWQDQMAESIHVEYNSDRKLLRVSSNQILEQNTSIYIYNELNERLIQDDFRAQTMLQRAYNLDGAPASTIEVIVSTLNYNILKEKFAF